MNSINPDSISKFNNLQPDAQQDTVSGKATGFKDKVEAGKAKVEDLKNQKKVLEDKINILRANPNPDPGTLMELQKLTSELSQISDKLTGLLGAAHAKVSGFLRNAKG